VAASRIPLRALVHLQPSFITKHVTVSSAHLVTNPSNIRDWLGVELPRLPQMTLAAAAPRASSRYKEMVGSSQVRFQPAEPVLARPIPAGGMEHLWSRADAIGRDSPQIGRPRNGSNKPKPLPTIVDSCAHNEIVKRGSAAPGPAPRHSDKRAPILRTSQ